MIDSIVLNIPHSSSEFPGTAKDGWENGIDEHIQRWTDWGTDRLFGMASSMDPRIHPVTFPWSRFFCDVERLENDPLEKIDQGIVYSSFEGIGRNITGTEIIYRSYYLGHKAAAIKELTPSSILIDCHSFPSDLSDVEVCIGFNDDWSMPDKDLLSQIESMFRSRGHKTAFNKPYSNSYAPKTRFGYPSLMIELNKSTYMDADGSMDNEKSEKIMTAIREMYEMILRPCTSGLFFRNAGFLYEKRNEIWASPRMASALTETAYFNGKRATVGGFLKAVENHPDLFRCKDSIIVSFGGSIFSGATFNTAVNLKDGHTSSFKGGSFGSKLRAYIEGHAQYPVREDAFPLSKVIEMLKNGGTCQ